GAVDFGADLRGGLPGLFLRISPWTLGPSGARRDSREPGRGLSGGVRRRPARILRFDSARQADGVSANADRGSVGLETDPNVAGSAGGRSAQRGPRFSRADDPQTDAGHA